MSYTPTARRPIATLFRRTATRTVQLCLRLHISADAISYLSILFSAAAALCFFASHDHSLLLIPAALLCYARLYCNMLDGMVALAANTASPKGEILNDLPDRLSDLLIFAGVAHSSLCNPFLAYWTAIAALLTAYVGTLGQAVGASRQFAGLMSKPWRMVALHLGAWTHLTLTLLHQPTTYATLTILDYTLIFILLGCLQTIAVRLKKILQNLRKKSA